MFERFTERARQVIVNAQGEARILKHDWIGSGHLLAGLRLEEEGVAARVLSQLGVSVERVRAEIVKVEGIGEARPSDDQQLPFTPGARRALELALREALSLGHNYIGTEHILLALVREDGAAARILAGLDVDSGKVRDEVLVDVARPRRRVRASSASVDGGRSWLVRLERPEGFAGLDVVGVVTAESPTHAIVQWLSDMHGGSWSFVRVSAELVQPHPLPG